MPEGKEHFSQGFANANVPSIPELVTMAKEMGVQFIGCQMTMDEVGGAVTFLEFAKDADVTLAF